MIKLSMNRQNWKMLLLCLTAPLVFTACGGGSGGGGGSSTADTTAPAATPGRMPDTNQTMSYTNTIGEDHDYTINPPSYTDNGNGTVTDNVTGFVWQKQDDGVSKTWADAGTYCDASTLGGYSDWRLPSLIELISIIDNGVHSPSINKTFFPGTISSGYWSSTTYQSIAWSVIFGSGYPSDAYTYFSGYYVRCVRGGQTTPSLTDNGNGTVTDSGTLLTWQQGENPAMTWEAALSNCEGLSLAGSTDWRLPNQKELLSLVYNPSINMTFFPGSSGSNYWSSTTVASSTSFAWRMGYPYDNIKTGSGYVRCVRGGQ